MGEEVYWLVICVKLTQARAAEEEGSSPEKMPPFHWQVGNPVGGIYLMICVGKPSPQWVVPHLGRWSRLKAKEQVNKKPPPWSLL